MASMDAHDKVVPSLAGRRHAAGTAGPAANDSDPFDGSGAGDWGEQWVDRRLHSLFEADAQTEPSPRLAELLRRLEASLERDRRD